MNQEIVLFNGKITTLDRMNPEVSALHIQNNTIAAVGNDEEILSQVSPEIPQINLHRRRVIPGLNDSHLHVIRAGLFFNLELRWDGVPTLSQAMEQLRVQAVRTPSPHPDQHGHEHPAGHQHWILGADGRAWQSGCGCSL